MLHRFGVLCAMGVLLVGCARQERKPVAEPATDLQSWTVKGTVVAVNRAEKMIILRHEEIPGLMAAMTMGFPVEHADLLEGFEPGDDVEFVLSQRPERYVITDLRKRPVATPPPTGSNPVLPSGNAGREGERRSGSSW